MEKQHLIDEIDRTFELNNIKEQYLKEEYITIKVSETLIFNATAIEIFEELEKEPELTKQIITEILNTNYKINKAEKDKQIIFSDIPKKNDYITKISHIREKHFDKLITIQGIINN